MFEPKEIGDRMTKQDNYGTAHPYVIVLQQKVERIVPVGHGDEKRYYDSESCSSWNSIEEFRTSMDGSGYEPEEIDKFVDSLEEYEIKEDWEDMNWFFTNEGYDEHLRLNKHNYRKEIRPYIKHMFRNPEMAEIWKHLKGLNVPQ